MAKSVCLKSGLRFGTIKQAKQYFHDVRDEADIGSSVSDGVKADIIDLYNRYCEPPRDCRRPFGLNYAAMGVSSSMA